MEINYFDIIVSAVILLLGLKGIINGFFKELFGLLGIIGGIFIASRMGDDVGNYLNNLIFHFSSEGAVSFMGFLVTLAIFWIAMIAIGYAFKHLITLSGHSIWDRMFGFVFGAGKFFFIASVIAFALYNSKTLKPSLEDFYKSSRLFPVMVETGSYIMKIDTKGVAQTLKESVNQTTDSIKESVSKATEKNIQQEIEKVKEKLQTEAQEK